MAKSCRVYINQITKDDRERKRLEDYHNQIFKRVADSGHFRKWNQYHFLPEATASGKYSQAKAFITSLNQEYGVPVADTAFTKATGREYVFVNVRNLLSKAQEEPIVQGTLFNEPESGPSQEFYYSRISDSEEIKGELRTNQERIRKLMGSSMYMSNIGEVAHKEIFQNSFDAVKSELRKGTIEKGKIDILQVDTSSEKSITYKDNGSGMTPSIIQNAFFTIAGTDKEGLDTSERSGGLGLAKIAILESAKLIELDTVRDGVRSTVAVEGDKLHTEGFTIKTQKTDLPNGTTLKLTFPTTFLNRKGGEEETDLPNRPAILGRPLLMDGVEITFKNKSGYASESTKEGGIPPHMMHFTNANTDWGTMKIYLSKDEKQFADQFIFSSGLFQFPETFSDSELNRIPLEIYIDLKPTVTADDSKYPFDNQREGFRPSVASDVKELKTYIRNIWHVYQMQKVNASLNRLFNVDLSKDNILSNSQFQDYKNTQAENKVATFAEFYEGLKKQHQDLNHDVKVTGGGVIGKSGEVLSYSGEKGGTSDRKSTFKAEKSLSVSMNKVIFDPSKPIIHNNTTFDINPGSFKYFQDLGSWMINAKKIILDESTYLSKNLKDQGFGVSVDKGYGGVNILLMGQRFLFLNPFSYLTLDFLQAKNPITSVVSLIEHVFLHEINHNFVRSEGAAFTGNFPMIYAAFQSMPSYKNIHSALTDVVTENFDNILENITTYENAANLGESFKGERINQNTPGISDSNAEENAGAVREGGLSGERIFAEGSDKEIGDLTSRFKSLVQFKKFSQKSSIPASRSSAGTIRAVKEFLKRAGIDIKPLQNKNVNGSYLDDNGVADILNSLIYISEGKEEVALTEEAMHFAVELIKQTNPSLYRQMQKEIPSFNIYRQVLNTYRDDTNYLDREGKPDIPRLKEEAMGKVLAETLIFKNEGGVERPENLKKSLTWWERIVQWFKSLFQKPGFSPFGEAAEQILAGENIGTKEDIEGSPQVQDLIARVRAKPIRKSSLIASGPSNQLIPLLYDQLNGSTYDSTVELVLNGDRELAEDILDYGRLFLQKGSPDPQTELYNSLIEQGKRISRPVGDEGKYKIGDKDISKRVTDASKRWFERIFGDKEITKSEYQKAVDDLKKESGTAGHKDMEHAFHTLVDDQGYMRANPLEEEYVPITNTDIYNTLRKNLQERLASFPEGTRFLSEIVVYDPKRDVAGTMDFLAIEKTGKVSILDWKFMDLDINNFTDVPWYKKKAFRLQIAEYKRILADTYGVKLNNFAQTKAIPIRGIYAYRRRDDGKKYPILSSIEIGEVNVKLEKTDYLLPVALETETTGDPKLDAIIRKLNGLAENIEGRKVKSFEEKFAKAEQLQAIEKAIRHLQIKNSVNPLLAQADVFNKDVRVLIEQFKVLENKDFGTLPKSVLSEYARRLVDDFDDLRVYADLDNETKHLYQGKTDEESKSLKKRTYEVVAAARDVLADLKDVINAFGEKAANAKGEFNIADPEVAVSGNRRMFNETSKLPTSTIRTLYEYRREAQNRADLQTSQENQELLLLNEEYTKLAKSKGLNKKNFFSLITKNDKNELLDQYQKDFYKEVRRAAKEKDIAWIKENVDIEAYKAKLAEEVERKEELINARPWDEEKKNAEISRMKSQYSTTDDASYGWFLHKKLLRLFPLQKWESQEWQELHKPENRAALDLYNWVIRINEKADEAGYLPQGIGKSPRVFLPVVPQSLMESLLTGGKPDVMERWMTLFTVDEDTIGYGSIDKVTGKIVNKIPRYFISDTEKQLSTDLVKNLALYNEFVNKYKEISDIEGIVLALGAVERNKGSIITSFFGKPKFNKETNTFETIESNERNANLYERQVSTLIYGQKYVADEKFDQMLGNAGEIFKRVNSMIGFKMFPESFTDQQLSMNKSIDTLNNFFQMKTLGLSALPALSNYIGGNLQIAINAGRYFTKVEAGKAELRLMGAAISGEQGRKLIAAMKYFIPFTRDVNRDLMKQLSITPLTNHGIQDFLMVLMRLGDRAIEGTIFTALMDNAILIDGKIHNAREYVRNSDEYRERYNNGTLKEQEGEFQKKVDELLEKHSLLSQIQIGKDDVVTIPGVDPLSPDVFAIRDLAKALSKRAVGNMSQEEVRGVSQNIMTNSMMIFKNWLPALLDTRYGALKYSSDIESYEWGRMRTMARILAQDGLKGIKNMYNAVKGTEGGIESLNRLYEYKKEKYYQQTGKELKMTKEEFYDLVRGNIRQQAKDLLITLSALSAFILVKVTPPDEDEDPAVKNWHKFMHRAIDKISDEVSLYYSPISFQQIVNGTIFPSLSIFLDFSTLLKRFTTEMYGIAFDQEVAEENQVLKYVMRSFPITSQMASYMPLYAPDLADSLGIRTSTRSRLIR